MLAQSLKIKMAEEANRTKKVTTVKNLKKWEAEFHCKFSYDLSNSLSNSNYFTPAKKRRRKSCIIDLMSAKMEFPSAIFNFQKNVFYQIFN